MYSLASLQPSAVWGNFIHGEIVTDGGGAGWGYWGGWEGWDGDGGMTAGVGSGSVDGAGLSVCVSLQIALFLR